MIKNIPLFFVIILIISSCVSIKPTAVDEDSWLGNKKNENTIYRTEKSEKVIVPFNLNLDNFGLGTIRRIFLIAIDEPEFYRTIELQEIVDGRKKSALVILYHPNDTLCDVIHLPEMDVRQKQYEAILNKVNISEQLFLYKFEVDYKGVYVYLKMKDAYGRNIEMEVSENRSEQPHLAILAPVGSMSRDPEFFPFIYMMDFGLVHRHKSNITLTIGGKPQKIEEMPVDINDEEVYNAKYSDKSVITSWNVERDSDISAIDVTNLKHEDGLITTNFINNNGHYEIKSYTGQYGDSEVRFTFSPPFPDVVSLKDDLEIEGKFSASIDDYRGIFAGYYEVEKKGDTIEVEIEPTEGWQPMPGKLWLKKYDYKAIISIKGDKWHIRSEWMKED